MSAENYKPRLCHIKRGPNGYGFHLHGEKGKFGQMIRKIEADSPAAQSGLKQGDRVVAVNGQNVENCTHQQVVARIKEKSGETNLLVVDKATDSYFLKKNAPVTEQVAQADGNVTKPAQEPPVNGQTPSEEAEPAQTEQPEKEEEVEVVADDPRRPRLCHLIRAANGFGFNLHSDKSKKGRYIRTVDEGSPAETSGLRAGDRLIEVNGTNMEYERHQDVVQTVKDSGKMVDLLVVSEESDVFFKSCDVTPTAAHCTGPLPLPGDRTNNADDTNSLKSPDKSSETSYLATSEPKIATTSNSVDLLTADLDTLKELTKRNKKKAPNSRWNNRQAIFNNL